MCKKVLRLLKSILFMCAVSGIVLILTATMVYYLRLDVWVVDIGVMLTYALAGLCGGRSWEGNPLLPSTLYWGMYVVVMKIITPDNMKNIPQLILIWIILITSCALGKCKQRR